jgi:hypothetical protein
MGLNSRVAVLPFEHRFVIDPGGLVDFFCSYTSAWSPYMADRKIKSLGSYLKKLAREPLPHRIAGNLIKKVNPDGRSFSPREYHGWNLEDAFPGYTDAVEELIGRLTEFKYPGSWAGAESYRVNNLIYHSPPFSEEKLAAFIGVFLEKLIVAFLEKEEKELFAEDNTWNILFADRLLAFLPEAKFIHIYRDPRDVVASFVKQRWCPADPGQAVSWYSSIMDRQLGILEKVPHEKYIQFSLEDMVSAPENIFARVCEFSGIPFEEKMLETDLSGANSGRWKNEFSGKSREILENGLGKYVDKLGYGDR